MASCSVPGGSRSCGHRGAGETVGTMGRRAGRRSVPS